VRQRHRAALGARAVRDQEGVRQLARAALGGLRGLQAVGADNVVGGVCQALFYTWR
jgi:hypothetical protein